MSTEEEIQGERAVCIGGPADGHERQVWNEEFLLWPYPDAVYQRTGPVDGGLVAYYWMPKPHTMDCMVCDQEILTCCYNNHLEGHVGNARSDREWWSQIKNFFDEFQANEENRLPRSMWSERMDHIYSMLHYDTCIEGLMHHVACQTPERYRARSWW